MSGKVILATGSGKVILHLLETLPQGLPAAFLPHKREVMSGVFVFPFILLYLRQNKHKHYFTTYFISPLPFILH